MMAGPTGGSVEEGDGEFWAMCLSTSKSTSRHQARRRTGSWAGFCTEGRAAWRVERTGRGAVREVMAVAGAGGTGSLGGGPKVDWARAWWGADGVGCGGANA